MASARRSRTIILVVEDDSVLQQGLAEIFTLAGYEVITANNGREALQTLRFTERLPGLIVSDLVMQAMDGRTLWYMLQSEPVWHSIPFLFITGAYQIPKIVTTLIGSRENFLLKPFMAEELLLMTKRLLLQAQVG